MFVCVCQMIAWFGPLERQLEEGLFYGHLQQNICLEETLQPPFLVIAVLQNFMQ